MPHQNSSPRRRDIVAGLAALGASALLPAIESRAQTPAGTRVIDCHHHFVSPAFLKALTAKEGHKVEGFTSFFPLGLWRDFRPPETSRPWTGTAWRHR